MLSFFQALFSFAAFTSKYIAAVTNNEDKAMQKILPILYNTSKNDFSKMNFYDVFKYIPRR